jgi:putative two-component system response regulator
MLEDLLFTKTSRAPGVRSVKQPDLSAAAKLVTRAQRTVLLVDARPKSRKEIRGLLELLGHRIFEAATQDDALRTLSSQKVDLVLADIASSDVDSVTFCKLLRSDDRTRSVAIALIAAPEQASLELSVIAAGADEFLIRPVASGFIRARVQSLLRRTPIAGSADDFAALLFSLAQAVEARDPATRRHCHRVSVLCSRLGASLNLNPEDLVTLQRGAFLHDIGKIVVPDRILFKSGPLSAEEWSIMQNHTICGERICSSMKSLSGVLPIIRNHHERWDGSGYPDGLRGDEIPLTARIMQVADIYDALTTDRPYKPAFTPEFALQTLRSEAAAGWRDPNIVEAFADIFSSTRDVDHHSISSLLALSSAVGESTPVTPVHDNEYQPADIPSSASSLIEKT